MDMRPRDGSEYNMRDIMISFPERNQPLVCVSCLQIVGKLFFHLTLELTGNVGTLG